MVSLDDCDATPTNNHSTKKADINSAESGSPAIAPMFLCTIPFALIRRSATSGEHHTLGFKTEYQSSGNSAVANRASLQPNGLKTNCPANGMVRQRCCAGP